MPNPNPNPNPGANPDPNSNLGLTLTPTSGAAVDGPACDAAAGGRRGEARRAAVDGCGGGGGGCATGAKGLPCGHARRQWSGAIEPHLGTPLGRGASWSCLTHTGLLRSIVVSVEQ